jgi:hypothetical protein
MKGPSGNSEVLLYGCEVLGQARATDKALINQVARPAFQKFLG